MIEAGGKITINRVLVLTLWAAVVAERLGSTVLTRECAKAWRWGPSGSDQPMSTDSIWRWSGRAIWLVLLVLFGTGVYVNWHLPHGPLYDTGEVVCQNDDRGPCGEQYKEDMRGLNIPDWAKFFRTSEAELLLLGLALAGIFVSNRPVGGYKKED